MDLFPKDLIFVVSSYLGYIDTVTLLHLNLSLRGIWDYKLEKEFNIKSPDAEKTYPVIYEEQLELNFEKIKNGTNPQIKEINRKIEKLKKQKTILSNKVYNELKIIRKNNLLKSLNYFPINITAKNWSHLLKVILIRYPTFWVELCLL